MAAGPASRGTSLRMCGSGWGEGEKATDKFVEGSRLECYSAGLSISSAKSYFWLSDGRFLLRFPSPSLIPSATSGWGVRAAQPGLAPAGCLGNK